MRKALLLVLIVAALSGVVAVFAQEQPPPEIDAALTALSGQVGTTLTVDSLDSFTWSGQNFTDTSLGCPQLDLAYAQIQTPGFQFLLVYQGQTYDYRVTTGGASVILCPASVATETAPGATEAATAEVTATPVEATTEPTIEPTAAPTATETAPAVTVAPCTSGLTARLTVGQPARTAVGVSSNVRATADANGPVMGAVGAGVTFDVLDGPVCGPEGFNWWRVQQGALTGWVAEGQNGLYYLEPVPQPLPAPDSLSMIDAAGAPSLTQLARLDGNLSGVVAWSPDGTTLAVAGSNTVNPGVWLYAAGALDAVAPREIPTDAIPTALAFTNDGSLLAVGTAVGRVTFYDVSTGAAGFSFEAEPSAVRDLRFSPNGRLLAVAGEGTTLTFWGVPLPATEIPVIPTEEVTVESTGAATVEMTESAATPGAIPVTGGPTPTAQG